MDTQDLCTYCQRPTNSWIGICDFCWAHPHFRHFNDDERVGFVAGFNAGYREGMRQANEQHRLLNALKELG